MEVTLRPVNDENRDSQSPILQGKGLTVSQHMIIKYLYAAPADSVRLVDLEAFYSITHPAVIDVVKVLEKKGYRERIPNPADARSKILSLTEKPTRSAMSSRRWETRWRRPSRRISTMPSARSWQRSYSSS